MQPALIESGVVRTIEAISRSSPSDIDGELWPIAVFHEWQQWVGGRSWMTGSSQKPPTAI